MARTSGQRAGAQSTAARTKARATRSARASKRAVPKAPAGLGAAGRAVWSHVWRECPWVEEEHRLVVGRLCELYDDRAAMKKAVASAGYTSTGSTGQPVEHPLLGTIRATEVAINRVERQLGISISAKRAEVVADDITAEEARAAEEAERGKALGRAPSWARREDPRLTKHGQTKG
jgi:P27 family predicted phage terminase small subunit